MMTLKEAREKLVNAFGNEHPICISADCWAWANGRTETEFKAYDELIRQVIHSGTKDKNVVVEAEHD